MSEIQHWEIDQDFIKVCEENVNTVLDNLDLINPIKLKSFHNFDQFKNQWWDEFIFSYSNKKIKLADKGGKFKYLERSGIDVVDSITDNFSAKVFNDPIVTMWMSKGQIGRAHV